MASNVPGNQKLGTDSFTFNVFDSHSNYSLPATINVTVVSGVSSLVDNGSLWPCYEDTDNEVLLYGAAIDDSEGFLWFNITGIPHFGSLFDAATNSSVEVGSTLSTPAAYPYGSGTGVIYRPPRDFFTEPPTHWNGSQLPPFDDVGSISFHVFLELGTATVSSLESSQGLKVTNTNDNSTLNCTDQMLTVRAMGYLDDGDESRPDKLFIHNVSITEKDKGVDPIRVDLGVEEGYITLNETQLVLLEFSNLCSATRDWICKGDGVYEQSMVFIGSPKDVQRALYGMKYLNYEPYSEDFIDITLYDGSQGDCLREFSTTSLRPTCASSSCRMHVNVTSVWGSFEEAEDRDALLKMGILHFAVFLLFVGISTGVTVALACKVLRSCCCVACRIFRKGKTQPRRGKGGHTVSDQEGAAPKALKNARHTPANIPLGRAKRNQVFIGHAKSGKEANKIKQESAGVCPLPWSGSLRHYKILSASNAGVSGSIVGASKENPKHNPIVQTKSSHAKQPEPSWGDED